MALAWTCLEPLPGNVPAYVLGTSLVDVIPMTKVKNIGRNFSRGGPRGLPSHFCLFSGMGVGSTPIFGRLNGQNDRIFGSGGENGPLLPMPAYAYDDSTAGEACVIKTITGNTEWCAFIWAWLLPFSH